MKNLLLAMLMLISSVAMSQTMVAMDSTPKFTQEFLVTKGKLSLTKIYLNQVNELTMLIPDAAFNKSTVIDDIPNTSSVVYQKKRICKAQERYNKQLFQNFIDIVPYTDKANLIAAILYLQDIINDLR